MCTGPTFEGVVLGADGGVAADVTDDAAADLPRPRLGGRGRQQEGEDDAQMEEERPPRARRCGHGWWSACPVGRWDGLSETEACHYGAVGGSGVQLEEASRRSLTILPLTK
jgi:hypothetical protein